MSNTPRTDAEERPHLRPESITGKSNFYWVDADFARTLERELVQATTINDFALNKDYYEKYQRLVAELEQRTEEVEELKKDLAAIHQGIRNEFTQGELSDVVSDFGHFIEHHNFIETQFQHSIAREARLLEALKPFNLNMGPRLEHEMFQVKVSDIRSAASILSTQPPPAGVWIDEKDLEKMECDCSALHYWYSDEVHDCFRCTQLEKMKG